MISNLATDVVVTSVRPFNQFPRNFLLLFLFLSIVLRLDLSKEERKGKNSKKNKKGTSNEEEEIFQRRGAIVIGARFPLISPLV